MQGRENKKDNDLFFTCSLIEYIARKTKNKRSLVVNKLGKNNVAKIYDLADVYHSDNIETVSEDFINKASIAVGNFDNVSEAKYAVFEAYNSFVSDKIDDYNSSFYYEAPQNILNAYTEGRIE